MKTLWNMIDGHKTQITGALALVLAFAINREWVDQETANLITGLLAIAFGGAVAHAESKKK